MKTSQRVFAALMLSFATIMVAFSGCSLDPQYFSTLMGARSDGQLIRMESGEVLGGSILIQEDGTTFIFQKSIVLEENTGDCTSVAADGEDRVTVGKDNCVCDALDHTCEGAPSADQECEFLREDLAPKDGDIFIYKPDGKAGCALQRSTVDQTMRFLPDNLEPDLKCAAVCLDQSCDLYLRVDECKCDCPQVGECICAIVHCEQEGEDYICEVVDQLESNSSSADVVAHSRNQAWRKWQKAGRAQ